MQGISLTNDPMFKSLEDVLYVLYWPSHKSFIRQKSSYERKKQTNLNYQIAAAVDAC